MTLEEAVLKNSSRGIPTQKDVHGNAVDFVGVPASYFEKQETTYRPPDVRSSDTGEKLTDLDQTLHSLQRRTSIKRAKRTGISEGRMMASLEYIGDDAEQGDEVRSQVMGEIGELESAILRESQEIEAMMGKLTDEEMLHHGFGGLVEKKRRVEMLKAFGGKLPGDGSTVSSTGGGDSW